MRWFIRKREAWLQRAIVDALTARIDTLEMQLGMAPLIERPTHPILLDLCTAEAALKEVRSTWYARPTPSTR